MIKDIHAFGRIIQVDKAFAVKDKGRIGNGIEQLAEVGGLVYERSIIGNALELGIQLVEDPYIVIIRQANGLSLQDILITEIDRIDDIQKAVQFDDRRKVPVIDKDLEGIGD